MWRMRMTASCRLLMLNELSESIKIKERLFSLIFSKVSIITVALRPKQFSAYFEMFYLKARAKLLKTHFYQMGANINQTLFSAAFWCFRVSRLHFVFEIKEKLQYHSSFSTYTSLFLPLEGKGKKMPPII